MFPPKAAQDNKSARKISDNGVLLSRWRRPRLNFRNKSEIGKKVMTDNQVKAKLYESMSVKSGQRKK